MNIKAITTLYKHESAIEIEILQTKFYAQRILYIRIDYTQFVLNYKEVGTCLI